MYQKFWALKEKPFENTPDPRFLYLSHEHLEAATRLTYAVEERKGAALLTGEYGCGKTVISRMLFEILPKDKYKIALVTNPMLSPVDLLREICFQMGIQCSPESPKPEILKHLNEGFYENMKNNKDTVIIVDEAHSINDLNTFEELRLLLNFQLNNKFLLTLLLLGQPELREQINKLPQFKQRLAIKYHLNPLNKEETYKYIYYRLKIAGVEDNIFPENIVNLIWVASQGIPRVINSICDMSLLIGFTKKTHEITEEIVNDVISDMRD